MSRLRVAVAEDEDLSAKRLVRLLEEAGCEIVAVFREGRGLSEWLANPRTLDALFLDIHMPNLDGLAILKSLDGRIPAVLTTAFPEHAVEAFDSEATDYLLKPITASRLERALKRIESRRGPEAVPAPPPSQGPVRYPVHAGEGLVFVDLARTTHFEVENEVVFAHAGQRMRTSWTSLGEVEAAFPAAGLLRIHRHLLIRPEAVVGLRPAPGGRAFVRLTGGVEVEASRGGAPRLRERLGL
ncbi:LytR/AlgR family response regulator transcription factor [Mesoterricola sediminis]|uniref:Transcriptional regulatory protein YehT n=1 Tax=Mesoterricola sediminis TaxID=2927980 RepID=A0AA48GUZ9_9BACT|nr:LytTR family DNA-binding domain-containing protein [Mesoterricola sediminis]BDU76120.1 transcriptional regulatory protein YehT [Mesoterricola sediminis]